MRYDVCVFIAEILIYALQGILFCVLVFVMHRFVVRALSGLTDVPYVPTDREFLPNIEQALDIKRGDVVYDLGSGDGRVLFYCARKHPDATFIGLETNPLLFAQANLYKKIARIRNVHFRREDIGNADISDATRIYAFLLPEVMRDIAPLLKAPRIVSRAFEIPRRFPAHEFVLKDAPPDPWNTFTVYVYVTSPTGPILPLRG